MPPPDDGNDDRTASGDGEWQLPAALLFQRAAVLLDELSQLCGTFERHLGTSRPGITGKSDSCGGLSDSRDIIAIQQIDRVRQTLDDMSQLHRVLALRGGVPLSEDEIRTLHGRMAQKSVAHRLTRHCDSPCPEQKTGIVDLL